MAGADRSVSVTLDLKVPGFTTGAAKASAAVKDLASTVTTQTGQAAKAVQDFGTKTAGLGNQLAAGAGKAKAAVTDFAGTTTTQLGKAGNAVKDFGSSTAGGLSNALVAGANKAKTAVTDFANTTKTQLGRAAESVKDFSNQTIDFAAKHEGTFRAVGLGMAAAGAAIGAGIGLAVKAFADFDKEMANVRAVSNATAAELDQLTAAALDAGAKTKFSASDAAAAESELAKAGVSVNDILNGGLIGSLSLAAAGNLDLANAATIAAQAMNVFNLSGADVGHIADVLAAGANKSAADIDQLGQALRQGGTVASQLGIGLEDTVGVLAAFADNALIGSDAGTSLKTMLQRLVPQSDDAAQSMRDIGFSAYDAQGNFVGLDNVAQQLQDGLAGLTQKQRDQTLATIFGSDAVRAANVLYKLGGDGVRDYTKAVNDNGAAARVAAVQMDNLAGDLENLRGSIDTALIKGGSGANDALRGLTQAATEAVNAFGELPDGVQKGLVQVGALTSGLLLAGGAFVSVLPKIKATKEALDALSLSAPKASGALAALGKAGLVVGIAAAGEEIKNLAAAASVAQVPVDKLAAGLADLSVGANGQGFLELFNRGIGPFAKNFDNASDALKDFGDNARIALDPTLLEQFFGNAGQASTVFEARVKQIDAALAQLVQGGRADEAAAAFKRLQDAVTASGGNADALKSKFTGYQAAVDSAKVANGAFADSALDASRGGQKLVDSTDAVAVSFADAQGPGRLLAEEIGKQEKAAKDAQEAYDKLKQSVKDYGSAVDDALGSTAGFEKAIDDAAERSQKRAEIQAHINALIKDGATKNADEISRLKEQLKDYAKTLDLGTQAGRDNVQSLRDIAKAAKDAAVDNLSAGNSFDDVKKKFMSARDEFIKRAIDFGASKQEAQDLADKLGLTAQNLDTLNQKPPVNVKVNADTSDADKKIAGVNANLDVIQQRTATAHILADTQIFDLRFLGAQSKLDAMDRATAEPTLSANDKATPVINAAQGDLNRFDGQVAKATIQVAYERVGPSLDAIAGLATGALGPKGFAGGGPIQGPGTKTSDDILMWGSNGEFMQPAKAVDYYGQRMMEDIRQLRYPKFASGGPVKAGFADTSMVHSVMTTTNNNTVGGNVTNDRRINIENMWGANIQAVEQEADRRRRLDSLGTRRAR